NVQCLFCSHKFNPPGVKTYSFPARSVSEIGEDMALVKRLKTITIGESVTTLIEGEPLCHPEFMAIMGLVRDHYPHALIRLTTNGVLLTESILQQLKELGLVELTLSLNSVTAPGRANLGLSEADTLLSLLPRLSSYAPWHGSVVAMPHRVGIEDVSQTLEKLCRAGARTIRIFVPGFTRLAPADLVPNAEDMVRVKNLAQAMQARFTTPVLLEPDYSNDLLPIVQGSMDGSPARAAGFVGGEVVQTVNGERPRSRVHAFNLIESAENPAVRYKRGLGELAVTMAKTKGEKSGLVMQYDMSPLEMDDLLRAVEEAIILKKKVFVLASVLGQGIVRQVLHGTAARVEKVESRFFGGNIATAGLLTVEDFAHVLERERRLDGALVVLPHKAFDMRGRDLTGRSYLTLQDFGCRVVLV
ncbi:MAG: DUF512 domain-containing protein, partial [Bacillota bacterium]|nr:DUF512 domain-containing protein [Bacillota bacterium]